MSLSIRGYGIQKNEMDENTLIDLRNELTVDIDEDSALEKYVDSRRVNNRRVHMYLESDKKIYLPRAFGLTRFGHPDARDDLGLDSNLIFNGQLHPHQDAAVEAFMKQYEKLGIISIPCGGGKTVIALKIVSLVGKKTLIVLNKDFLIAQWRERISQFLPHASVGIIKANRVDIAGKDIVLASLQSLASKEYSSDFREFGMMVIDEVHRTGTHVFSRALKKLSTNVMLGLSATVDRKDGMEMIFKNYIGDVVYEIKARSAMEEKSDTSVDPEVKLIYFEDNTSEEYSRIEMISFDKVNHSKMINNVTNNVKRTQLAVSIIVKSVSEGRKCLVLCDRKTTLHSMSDSLTLQNVSSGLYVGGMKEKDLETSAAKDVVLATFAFASEGFDVQGIDTLLLLSPKTDVRQAVGRILRERPCDRIRAPRIFDIVDNFSVFAGQARKRCSYYRSQAFKIDKYNNSFL